MTNQETKPVGNQFGTMGGVFTPSILTILGVVMFMQAGSVIGRSGIFSAMLILLLAKMITFFTSLSIAGISTNTLVKGGGAYFLISRSLGPEPGGAIGLTLFLAQALSVPFYILGFTQAMVESFPVFKPYFLWIALLVSLLLFVINLVGADWAIKVQYAIFAVLVLAIVFFLSGAALHFKMETFRSNWNPHYAPSMGFWFIFATYFPAVTGIMTGVNMSGDLKEPAVSIPKGTFYAVGVGFLIYGLEILLCGGAQTRTQLLTQFYPTMLQQTLFGLQFFVIAGVFAATLSSAMGSMMGAPRILQALSKDELFPILTPFGKGSVKKQEPIRGLVLTFLITVFILFLFGKPSGNSSALDVLGAILTMFFLYAYGITNMAAFFESVTRNPSFRPRFQYFHWGTALLGALGCLLAALLINWKAALAATVVIVLLFLYIRRRILSTTFGDVRRGFYYSRVRENLKQLVQLPEHAKNWRPTTLVLTGNPFSRLTLTQYAVWLESNRGLATLVQILEGPFEETLKRRKAELQKLNHFIQEHNMSAFAEVLVTDDFDKGLASLLQVHSLAPIKPNLLMLGWSHDPQRAETFVKHLRVAKILEMCMVLTVDRGLPDLEHRSKRIDIWWRGHKNGSLMMILAYLLSRNPEWAGSEIRILRVVEEESRVMGAKKELITLMESSRISGTVQVVIRQSTFSEVLQEHSKDASIVFLGFEVPPEGQEEKLTETYNTLLRGLPTTLLISSSGNADLLA